MKKFITLSAVVSLLFSCGSGDRGELLNGAQGKRWITEKPQGMAYIPGGTFTMGSTHEDLLSAQDAPVRTVTVGSFYMDETEITNNQYRKFVDFVRDSVVRTRLAIMADEMGMDASAGGIGLFAFQEVQDPSLNQNQSAYDRYMYDNYYSMAMDQDEYAGRRLNKNAKLIDNPQRYPDEYYTEVMDSLTIPSADSFFGVPSFDVSKLKFKYSWMDKESAIRDNNTSARDRRSKYLKTEIVNVYPDTTRWVKEFNYSYNEPMHDEYFWHEAYGEYPVVGVNWYQAKAFAAWRTLYRNSHLKSRNANTALNEYRLPSETEWEYAARGGIEKGMYPWGGPYTTDEKACFLANFKPDRGDYAEDGALFTAEARSYKPNGYNLYNMAGNVAEWTNTPYDESAYLLNSALKPKDKAVSQNPFKVVRGGSWRDISYFLRVSTRDKENADSARSYIGFRNVVSAPGPNSGEATSAGSGRSGR
ncbi:gliding motility lipoprotein GldK [Paenimyroides tangerinum]|uniref:Gliding motility lipoprotein GldK n=1 Tax=Paenimyroides tangerinum TaxID=2488728 RepID=A0A3P3WFC8_9FLAO|nr:gliding motility lipoprotein GldK [Paenimyroides tangerinum]RRJ93128.1 gliding motility lipoprotein GldK [Paenimyroides tangerinum]